LTQAKAAIDKAMEASKKFAQSGEEELNKKRRQIFKSDENRRKLKKRETRTINDDNDNLGQFRFDFFRTFVKFYIYLVLKMEKL